jgi:hypothetical protein
VSQFDPAHPGELDVEHDRGELRVHQREQRRLGGRRARGTGREPRARVAGRVDEGLDVPAVLIFVLCKKQILLAFLIQGMED